MSATPAVDTEIAWVRTRLLAYVRGHVPDAEYATEPHALTGGFETRTYGFRLRTPDPRWNAPLVLRIYPRSFDPLLAARDETVQNALADAGFPVPRVLASSTDPGPLGGAFVIMDRFDGRDMFSAYFPRRATRMIPALAALHARLHDVDPAPVERALAAHPESEALARICSLDAQLDDMLRRIEASALGGLVPGYAWLKRNRPVSGARVVCHGDLHPRNVLVATGGDASRETFAEAFAVIDWSLAALAPPEYDVGNTRMLLSFAPSGLPWLLEPAAGVWRRKVIARRYVSEYRKLRPVDEDAVAYYEAWRCLRALCWAAGETHRTEAGDVYVHNSPGPWDAPRVSSRLMSRFHEISGVRVVLPS